MKLGIHAGHRDRMRNKLILFGSDIFTDHELLEMLLFSVIPYKNTNPIAINLIRRFSGIDGVFSASRDELLSVDGVGDKAAEMILAVGAMRLDDTPLGDAVDKKRRFDNYGNAGAFLVDYFDGSMGYKTVLLLLNNSMELIDVADMTETDYSSAAVKARDFLDAAITSGASVCIAAHNHPYGPCVPTVGDIETNEMISRAYTSAGITLIEHFIIIGSSFIGIMNRSKDDFPESTAMHRFAVSKEELK